MVCKLDYNPSAFASLVRNAGWQGRRLVGAGFGVPLILHWSCTTLLMSLGNFQEGACPVQVPGAA